MDTTQQGIIALLKSAITGERIALPEAFDVEEAYARVRKHHMAALMYSGAVNCGVDQQLPAMKQMFQSYCKSLQVHERQMRALGIMFMAFEEARVDYMPMKGCVLKALYPRPELRLMGDADILIRAEQYEKIIPIMERLGYQQQKELDYEVTWHSDALHVELHKDMISSMHKDLYAGYGAGWTKARLQEGTRYVLAPEEIFNYLVAHFAKHFQGSGIGCRHVLDLWVYLRHHADMDEAYIKKGLEQMGLWAFYQNIRKLIAVWFEDEVMDEKTDFISQVIFANGSWGSTSNATLNKGVQNMGKSGSVMRSRIAYIRHGLFPRKKVFVQQYPILKKHPWLLPVMWLTRLVKLAKDGARWRKHGQQLQLLDKRKLEDRKQMMEYVGLQINGQENK